MNIGLILSSGEGRRFGGSIPKQYCRLNGKQIISYSIDAMKNCKDLDEIYVICNSCYIEELEKNYSVKCIEGGATRNESLYNGLRYIKDNHSTCDNIFIQEAARPFITKDVVSQYIQKLQEYDAVITTKKITDSLGAVDKWYVNRENYFLVQAPEAFKFELIYENFDPHSAITATSQQLPENSSVYCNYEFRNNMKITYSADLQLAEMIMKGEKND